MENVKLKIIEQNLKNAMFLGKNLLDKQIFWPKHKKKTLCRLRLIMSTFHMG